MRDEKHSALGSIKRTALPALLVAGVLFSLYVNIQSLYTFPTPNSWIYWVGDETQAMAESRSQVTTLLYAYPNAIGSVFQHGSGILKGSVWITSLLYGGAECLIQANPVDVGRVVSFIIACVLLGLIYWVLRSANANKVIALTAILAFSTTDGFLIMSHCSRPDMLIALTDFLIISMLIRFPYSSEHKNMRTGIMVGLLIFVGLLVSAHVWLDCALSIIFILWRKGILKQWRFLGASAMVVIGGLVIVSSAFYLKTGHVDLWGPFDYLPPPLYRFFSPGAQRGNLVYRWFIATEWSPSYLVFGIPIIIGVLFLSVKTKHINRTIGLWFGVTFFLAFSVTYVEAILPRYYIYVLPGLTVSLALAAQSLWNSIGNRVIRTTLSCAILFGILYFAFQFTTQSLQWKHYAEEISDANRESVSKIIDVITQDPSESKRVIATTPSQYGLWECKTIIPIVPLFLSAPDSAWRSDTTPIYRKADYLVTNNSSRVLELSESDRSFSTLLARHLEMVLEQTGSFSDIGRSYSENGLQGDDTLRLYRILH